MNQNRIIRLLKTLYFQVVLAICAGVVLGHFWPEKASQLKPVGDAFINLIKMLIAPVIFCTIVLGMAGSGDLKKTGRVGVKALLYFEVVSTIALIIGLVVINVLKPGEGMHINPALLDTSELAKTTAAAQSSSKSTVEFLLDIIPHTFVDAFAKGNLLQILLISVLVGLAVSRIRTQAQPFLTVLESFSKIIFGIMHFIMKLAPIGAFGAMAFTIGKYGVGSLRSLVELMGSFYLCCLIFIFLVLGTIMRLMKVRIIKLLSHIKEELLIVLGTSSSEAALPGLMEKLEKFGCSRSVVGLVVPTGYSFNLDGTSIYLTMAAVFIAQATDTPLDISQQISLLLVLLVTSKGAAGVTGSGFITLAATLPVLGTIPVAGLAIIFGIDRFMSEARALTNLIGNAVATVVISKWENEFHPGRLQKSDLRSE